MTGYGQGGKRVVPPPAKPADARDGRIAGLFAKLLALREYKEGIEQQAATAEILRALSRSSPQPVFEAIVDHGHRLCGAAFSVLYLFDGENLHILADRQVSAKASHVLRGM